MTGIREETLNRDKKIYDAFASGTTVYAIASDLKTSRGNIYNAIKRYTDPVKFREMEDRYERNTKRNKA